MRIALISDIHGNLEALQAVFHDIKDRSVDVIHCLGDVVGYGADPVACLELVRKKCRIKLMGNHEYAALGLLPVDHLNYDAGASLEWTRGRLGDKEMTVLADFDMQTEVEGAHLVHASPWEPDQWHYLLSTEPAIESFRHFESRLCFFGHTHLPMIFSLSSSGNLRQQVGHNFVPDEETRYLVNIGSVGQPRDNDPRAGYVIWDTDQNEIDYLRVEYDIAGAQRKMRKVDAPAMLVERIAIGR
jgi:predicted phosphodiesterase